MQVASPQDSGADEELVRGLYREHAGPLISYVLRLTGGDRQRAEDVVQETLLRAWRHPEALTRAGQSPRGWLCTVARHLVIDAARSRQARPREVGEQALATLPASDELDRALLSWEVADALETLRPDHRAVLLHTYYRGLSVAQAAAALGVPAGTVK